MGVGRAVSLLLILSASAEPQWNLKGRPGEGYLVEMQLGQPSQVFYVLIDTGSSNLAVAGAEHPNIEQYFKPNLSNTYKDSGKPVSVAYSLGQWSGYLGRDYVYFPQLNYVPALQTDIAIITDSKDFYMKGSGWQGILGLAYPSISKPSSDVQPWLDNLQRKNNDKSIAFSLTLCGPKDKNVNDHYGKFAILNNMVEPYEGLLSATVIREWFYEVILTDIFVEGVPILTDCQSLNTQQTIVDSGTTNIRLPKAVFMELVKSLIFTSKNKIMSEDDEIIYSTHDESETNYNSSDNVVLTSKFWLDQHVMCWSTPQSWNGLPTISIEIASSDYQFFRINLSPESYIRRAFYVEDPKYCYKFAIESSDTGTILGVVALEGFQVIFNRTAKNVGFKKADCGPNVSIEGPFIHTGSESLIKKCGYDEYLHLNPLTIAAFIVCGALLLCCSIFMYLLSQWLWNKYVKYRRTSGFVSMSSVSLIDDR